MSKSQIYPLTKRPQLIDLNGESVNFRLEFQVKAIKPENEFQAIVLTQDQLDSVDLNKIEMKQAKGKINGNITANNNKYQNYFLVLKKKEEFPDHEVEVDIHIDQIPEQQLSMENENFTSRPQESFQVSATPTEAEPIRPFYRRPWFGVLVLIVLLGVGYFLYNVVYLKKPLLWFNRIIPPVSLPGVATSLSTVTTPVATAPQLQSHVAAVPETIQAAVQNTMVEPNLISQTPMIQINHPVENQMYTKLSHIASL